MPANEPMLGETWLHTGTYIRAQVMEVFQLVQLDGRPRMVRLSQPQGVFDYEYAQFLRDFQYIPSSEADEEPSLREAEEIEALLQSLVRHFRASSVVEMLRRLEAVARVESMGEGEDNEPLSTPEPQDSMQMDAIMWAAYGNIEKKYTPPTPGPTQWERLNKEDD
jgi:hypothetical protein